MKNRFYILLIFSILLISPLIDNGEAFRQTAIKIVANLQPGESETFQWGLNPETDQPVILKLRAIGDGAELLSFPETINALSNEWNVINITVSVPDDYQNNVKLEAAIYALLEGEKGGGSVSVNVEMKQLVTIIIGEPPIEEPEAIVEETPVEIEEEKPIEQPKEEAAPFTLSAPDEQEEGGGCLISTATYGSELAPQVQMLREIRDNSLLPTASGSAFMSGFNTLYYSFSPTIADWERESPIFREAVKVTLTPLITSLSILNYVDMDSEAEVLGYGISLILLNIGMYFVAPVIIITRLRR